MRRPRRGADGHRPPVLRSRREVTCEEAQDVLSSLLDGEQPPIRAADLEAHLTSCRRCQRFESLSSALVPRVSLRLARGAPDSLHQVLAALDPQWFDGQAANGTKSRRSMRHGRGSGRSLAKWAAAIAPAAVAVVALPLGTVVHPHLVPSHLPSPCTIWLRHSRLR
jgi:RNA polymerase sigma-70 factor, ECF subfamily